MNARLDERLKDNLHTRMEKAVVEGGAYPIMIQKFDNGDVGNGCPSTLSWLVANVRMDVANAHVYWPCLFPAREVG